MRTFLTRVLPALALSFGLTSAPSQAFASEPAEQELELSQTPGVYEFTWTGTILPGATAVKEYADDSPCIDNEIAEDVHVITITLANSRVYKEANASFEFSIAWEDSLQDAALNVVGPGGASLGMSDGGEPKEVIRISNLDEGDYRVLACGFSVAVPTDYKGKLRVDVTPRARRKSTVAAVTSPPTSRPGRTSGAPASRTGSFRPTPTTGVAAPAAVGAGRIAPSVSGSVPAPSAAGGDAAPTAFQGFTDDGVTQTAAPTGFVARGDTAERMPTWVALVVGAAGLAAMVVALLLRRRRGLDRAAVTTDIVPLTL